MLVDTQTQRPLLTLTHACEAICVGLQPTETMDGRIRSAYDELARVISQPEGTLKPFSPDLFAQGSRRTDTTIRPLDRQEFDLDAVCLLATAHPRFITPQQVYELVYQQLASNGRYEGRLERLRRCVRIHYADGFHVDVVPAVLDTDCAAGSNCILVPDRGGDLGGLNASTVAWKPSNPRGFADEFREVCRTQRERPILNDKRAAASVEPLPDSQPAHRKFALQRTVQLFKRWRDRCWEDDTNLATPSIVLTQLSAEQYCGAPFADEALDGILTRLSADLLMSDEPPRLFNPANPKEIISEKWLSNSECFTSFQRELRDFQHRWRNLCTGNYRGGMAFVAAELAALFDGPGRDTVAGIVNELAGRRLDEPLSRRRATSSIVTAPGRLRLNSSTEHEFRQVAIVPAC